VRVAALVESLDHVCCRYRLRAFRDEFRRAGHVLELHALPQSWWGRATLGSHLGAADIVVLQRKLLPVWQLAVLRRRVRRLIFDVDDAVFLRDSYSRRSAASASRWRRFRATVQTCDAVVCGNEWLAGQARHAGAVRTHVIPTCVDPTAYPLARHDGDAVRMVWVGSSSTLQGLERARPLLDAVGASVPGVQLKVVCDRFPAFDRLPVEPHFWSEESEAAEIAVADIGIASVPDDDWSLGKCGLKVLQYMAAGLPVVANPVGVHAAMVRPGETGYLATTAAEWIEAVGRLARDADMRRRMGMAGRRVVEHEFSVSVGADGWRRLLASMAGGERRIA
jgi:glycosyltransferase involved in cell wall biosynthesis